ncbi:hypothetical protein V8F33_009243 [Rhypophila sp. PSN 637]
MSSSTQPVLRKVDISASPAVLTVATTLRRLWLVDPSSPVLAEKLAKAQEEGGHEHEHEHDHTNCEGHDHAHEADLDDKEHDHTNCSGHGHSHAHSHKEGDEAESDHDDESSCGCGHPHDDDDDDDEVEYLYQIFPLALQDIADPIGEEADPNNDVYDDAKWMASTNLVLIDPPTGPGNPIQVPPGFSASNKDADSKDETTKPDETKDEAAEQSKDTDQVYKPDEPKDADADAEEEEDSDDDDDDVISSPLFTPFRQQVYGLYNHVFFDAHSALTAQLASAEGSNTEQAQIGKFEPPATTVMVLEAPEEDEPEKEKGIPHEFETDTFVYPVWIARGTELTIKKEGETETMVEFTDEGKKWTEVLWFKAGTKVVVYPESEDSKAKGVVALLCLGVCDPVGDEGEGEGEGAADGAEMC